MMCNKKWIFICSILFFAFLIAKMSDNTMKTQAESSEKDVETLIDLNTDWTYYDYEVDPVSGSDRTAWTKADFDVSGWKQTEEGVEAKFGAKKGKLKSVDSHMPAVLLTQYKAGTKKNIEAFFFRTTFQVDDINSDHYLMGEILYDDAALIYLNGELVGEFSNRQKADATKKFDANMQYGGHGSSVATGRLVIPAAKLLEGENIIAVELHQTSASSSDIYFQMSSLELGEFVAEQKTVALTVGEDEASRNITWYCNEKTAGKVQYAVKKGSSFPKSYQEVEAEIEETAYAGFYGNKAELTGLQPDTEYVYRLINETKVSKIYTFNTTEDGSFCFLAAGDPQIGASGTESDAESWNVTLSNILELYPEAAFLITAGDQVNKDGNESQYEAFLDATMESNLPLAASIGNHDSDSEIFSQHYHHPNVTSYGASDAGTDYWFVYNNVLFMNMNSNSNSIAEHRAFIKEAVEKNPEVSWKVVTFHHSIYSAAGHAAQSSILQRRENYVPMFEEYDIDVVLMGHDHVYVRSYMMDGFTPNVTAEKSVTNPEGILYMTLNSGSGSKYYNISGQYEYAAVQSQEKIPTISRIEVTDESFKITTHRVDDSMSVLDEFTIYHKEPEFLDESAVKMSFTKCTYSGNYKRPKVTIEGLKKNVDYTVKYENNQYPGKATVTITGIGDYQGTVVKELIIKPKAVTNIQSKLVAHDDVSVSWDAATGADGYKLYYKRATGTIYNYAGTTNQPSWIVKDLMDGHKYVFKIVPYVMIDGKMVSGLSNTTQIYTLGKTGGLEVTTVGKRFKVAWSEVEGADGYQISRSSKKTGTYLVSNIEEIDELSAFITATKGKQYYVKVRAYVIVDGVVIKGPWSTVKAYKR